MWDLKTDLHFMHQCLNSRFVDELMHLCKILIRKDDFLVVLPVLRMLTGLDIVGKVYGRILLMRVLSSLACTPGS